ncbi:hypothetical protein SDC9_16937 [bioreactor metagenome]|uniref:Uncharacterized protein n=1 Tax=bioreactor metagenome TaxID=1076179 RepID=A0A644TW00_9ZZZZ
MSGRSAVLCGEQRAELRHALGGEAGGLEDGAGEADGGRARGRHHPPGGHCRAAVAVERGADVACGMRTKEGRAVRGMGHGIEQPRPGEGERAAADPRHRRPFGVACLQEAGEIGRLRAFPDHAADHRDDLRPPVVAGAKPGLDLDRQPALRPEPPRGRGEEPRLDSIEWGAGSGDECIFPIRETRGQDQCDASHLFLSPLRAGTMGGAAANGNGGGRERRVGGGAAIAGALFPSFFLPAAIVDLGKIQGGERC